MEIESAVEVVLNELTSRPDRGELIYANVYRLSFYSLTAACEFIELFSLNFLLVLFFVSRQRKEHASKSNKQKEIGAVSLRSAPDGMTMTIQRIPGTGHQNRLSSVTLSRYARSA